MTDTETARKHCATTSATQLQTRTPERGQGAGMFSCTCDKSQSSVANLLLQRKTKAGKSRLDSRADRQEFASEEDGHVKHARTDDTANQPTNKPTTTFQAQTSATIIAFGISIAISEQQGEAIKRHRILSKPHRHHAQLQNGSHARAPSHVHIIGPLPSADDHKMIDDIACSGLTVPYPD